MRETVFGIVDLDEIELPEFERRAELATVLDAADFLAWYQFQWEKQIAFTHQIWRFINQLDRYVTVSANPIEKLRKSWVIFPDLAPPGMNIEESTLSLSGPSRYAVEAFYKELP